MFAGAKFSRCAENVVTLLKDGSVDIWNIDALNGKKIKDDSLVTVKFS